MSELLFLFSLKKKKKHICFSYATLPSSFPAAHGEVSQVRYLNRNNCFGSPHCRSLHFIPDVLESYSSLYSKGDKSEGNSYADNGGFVARYFLKMFYQGVKQADNMLVLIC